MTERPRRKIKLDFWFFVKAFVLVALCLFIIYPFYTILTKSIFSDKVEGMTLYNFQRFFTKKYYYRTLIRSLVICSLTTLFACIIGVFIAYVMTRYNIPG
ncbi:MAG: iron ABC transporter permease, partial [Clostridia bacterium]|nr:iron ABC transporter permease [Clostridia bacterium]